MTSHQHDTLRAAASDSLPVAMSGIRVTPPDDAALAQRMPSPWQLTAVLAWLLVLAVLGVLTLHLGMWMAWLTSGIQVALIAGVFMRLSWDTRVNWIFGLLALFLVAVRFGLVLADRSEYQPELDRYEGTPIDPNARAPSE